MTTLALHLRIAGVLLLGLAAAHVAFPRRFRWKEELARLSPLNRQIFLVHCLFIVLILVMMGGLSVFLSEALLVPSLLSRALLGGLVFFWGLRLYVQWFVYDRSLWRGQPFNTVIHFLFTGIWTYLVAVYGAALWSLGV